MNKEELIEALRYDAEWWLDAGNSMPMENDLWEFEAIRGQWGWEKAEGYEIESWFNLLIAEALETENVEYVNPTLHTAPSVMLINAMATVAPESFQELFNPEYVDGKCFVKVELKVNGVQVPFMEEVERGWKILEASLDKEVEKRALELINGSGLIDLKNAIDNAQWQIEDALRAALEKK